MEDVYRELDEVKAELEKLKVEHGIKTELCQSLKKAHNEQLIKFQESKLQIEKQNQELTAKFEEISLARQMYEKLKSSLHEKELLVRHLSFANEKLRADWGEKVQKLEGQNRELVLVLDETTVRNKDLEQEIRARREEIEGLKRLLSVTEKKCFEAEQKAQSSKELRHGVEIVAQLEEDIRNHHEQLKWKKEQFEHLEEAHKRLQDQFQSSKEEREREKSALLEEINALQTSLDSQNRISESLQTKLKMCNQALAHEESRRKLLEVQMSESSSRFNSAFTKCQEAESKSESLSIQRDKEIAHLRNLLETKEILFKEMEIKIIHLEQENQEVKESLNEVKESQIDNAGAVSSLIKLQNKLRGLEEAHGNCFKNIKARESQLEEMKGDITGYISKLKGKEKQLEELKKELEGCHFSLQVLDEAMDVVFQVMKSEFSERQKKKVEESSRCEHCIKEIGRLELESMRREFEAAIFAQLDAEKTFEQEKEKLLEVTKAKEQNIEDLRVLAMSLEQDFMSTTISHFSQVTAMEIEINSLNQALNNAEYLIKVEMEEKEETIAEMQREVSDSKHQVEQLEALMKAKDLEIENLKEQFRNEKRSLEFEKEDALVFVAENCDRIGDFSCEYARLSRNLGKILQKTGREKDLALAEEVNDTMKVETCSEE